MRCLSSENSLLYCFSNGEHLDPLKSCTRRYVGLDPLGGAQAQVRREEVLVAVTGGDCGAATSEDTDEWLYWTGEPP